LFYYFFFLTKKLFLLEIVCFWHLYFFHFYYSFSIEFWRFFRKRIFCLLTFVKQFIFSTWLPWFTQSRLKEILIKSSISQSNILPPPEKLQKRQRKKARVMIYFKSCFSAILYSQTHFCTMLCFSRQFFERKQKNKPNYFWCDHFNFKNHQSSSSSILITKKIINFCIENWHPFLSNLSTHYKQWKIKKNEKTQEQLSF